LIPIMAPAMSVKTRRSAISAGPISICTNMCYDPGQWLVQIVPNEQRI
jgi:hypothetical protein